MRSLAADKYGEWGGYPQNLPLSSFEVDASRSSRRISRLSKELFVPNHESTFGYMALGPPGEGMYLEFWRTEVPH